jgi:carbonic anhydrase/acetyltransferase-like protein (isoleucine patch superfamily)
MPIRLIPHADRSPSLDGPIRTECDAAVAWGGVRGGQDLHLARSVVLRAALGDIFLGERVFLGAASTVASVVGGASVRLGADATLGPHCVVEGAQIGESSVLEDRVVVLSGACIDAGAWVEAGSLVDSDAVLRGGWLYRGWPAQAVRPLEGGELSRAHARLRQAMHAWSFPDIAGVGDVATLAGRAVALADQEVDAALAALGLGKDASRSIRVGGPWGRGAFIIDEHLCDGVVRLDEGASVWFSSRLDGGTRGIHVGPYSIVGDNVVAYALSAPIKIGQRAMIDAACALHDCQVGDRVWMGAGCFVSAGTRIDHDVRLLPGTATRPGQHLTAGVWAGKPAQRLRDLSPDDWSGWQNRRDGLDAQTQAWLDLAAAPPV